MRTHLSLTPITTPTMPCRRQRTRHDSAGGGPVSATIWRHDELSKRSERSNSRLFVRFISNESRIWDLQRHLPALKLLIPSDCKYDGSHVYNLLDRRILCSVSHLAVPLAMQSSTSPKASTTFTLLSGEQPPAMLSTPTRTVQPPISYASPEAGMSRTPDVHSSRYEFLRGAKAATVGHSGNKNIHW